MRHPTYAQMLTLVELGLLDARTQYDAWLEEPHPPKRDNDNYQRWYRAANRKQLAEKARKRYHATKKLKGKPGGNRKLSEDDVRAIRQDDGATSKAELARRYGVSRRTILLALRGDTWGGVG